MAIRTGDFVDRKRGRAELDVSKIIDDFASRKARLKSISQVKPWTMLLPMLSHLVLNFWSVTLMTKTLSPL